MVFSYRIKIIEESHAHREWISRWVKYVTSSLAASLQSVNNVCISLKRQGRPLESADTQRRKGARILRGGGSTLENARVTLELDK
jgi:hypothetical protein